MVDKVEETEFLYEFADLYALYVQPLDVFDVCLTQHMLKERFPPFMASCSVQNPPAIFYTGGHGESGSYRETVCILLNLIENTHTQEHKAKMTHAHYSHGMTAINDDQLFVVSGYDHEQNASSRCERYYVSKDKWYDMASIPTPRGSAAVCTLEQQFVYVFGGATDGSERTLLNAIEVYRVVPDRWSTVKLISNQGWAARLGAAACAIDNDTILVFGGTEGLHYIPSPIIE